VPYNRDTLEAWAGAAVKIAKLIAQSQRNATSPEEAFREALLVLFEPTATRMADASGRGLLGERIQSILGSCEEEDRHLVTAVVTSSLRRHFGRLPLADLVGYVVLLAPALQPRP
jgi:hypothetical protein